jgi:hypothetical protein
MAQSPAERLADASRARRSALGITQPAAAKAGGIGVSTLRQIETATQTGTLTRKTSLGLDRALRWKPGSTALILNGDADTAEPLDTEGWPTSSGDWGSYVARRERESEEADEVSAGAAEALIAAERDRETRDHARLINQFSDAELIAELARRLAEAGRLVTPPAAEEE